MLLFLIFMTVSGAVAVQWTSTSTFPNGSLVQACVGDNISLPWDFIMTSPQRIFIEWFKVAGKSVLPTNQNKPHRTINLCSNDSACTDHEEIILAYYFRGVFAPFSSLTPHIDFIPNAGIILPMATLSDTGYYRAELNVRGDLQTYVQGAFVHVSEGPVTIDGRLHAYILPKSVYQETTGQWHLQIGCGTFLSLGQPAVSVKWNTPSREIINSTSYANGAFILTVSNPVEDGEYSCFLERISPAVVCLHNQSSMNRAATVDVKGVYTRISLLEGGLEALREETVNLTVPVSDLEDLVHKLETSNKIFKEKMEILQDTIFNITTENKQLRQEVQRLERVVRNVTDLMQENNRNITSENKQLRQEVQRLESVDRNIMTENTKLRHQVERLESVDRNITDLMQENNRNITSENKQLRQVVQRLENVDINITTENKQLRQEVQRLENVDRNITTENKHLRQEVQRLESVDRNIMTENTKLRQEVQRLERVVRNVTDLMQENNRNITGMVHDVINQIKDVKGDVRKLQSDKDDLVDTVFVKDQFGLSRIQQNDSNEKPSSCKDVKNYDSSSGIHTLFLGNNRTLNVYCDQSTDNGGWMVIQRRQDGSVNFYRDWNQYEMGFGNMTTEFWIGFANLHHLTKSQTVKLRVDLTDFNGSTAYAVYNTFSISGADDNYRLNVGGYSGTAGDSLTAHSKMQFTTFDRDHDTYSGNCAERFHGAWWYASSCHYSNLNGRYKSDGALGSDGVNWLHWKYDWRSFKRVEMKIKE